MSPKIRHHINVIQFKLHKPAHLPFHLLVWGQYYIKQYNCMQFYNSSINITISSVNTQRSLLSASSIPKIDTNISLAKTIAKRNKQKQNRHFNSLAFLDNEINNNINYTLIPKNNDLYEICYPNSIQMSWGGPFNISYTKKNLFSNIKTNMKNNFIFQPIRYVYYTECDQIVRFDSDQTLLALSLASNSTTFFVGTENIEYLYY